MPHAPADCLEHALITSCYYKYVRVFLHSQGEKYWLLWMLTYSESNFVSGCAQTEATHHLWSLVTLDSLVMVPDPEDYVMKCRIGDGHPVFVVNIEKAIKAASLAWGS